jgi:hypothetical protein
MWFSAFLLKPFVSRVNRRMHKRAQIIAALVEGNSLRATARMCNVAFNTVLNRSRDRQSLCEVSGRAFTEPSLQENPGR